MRGDFPAAAACLRPHQSPAVTAVPRNGENLSRPGEAFCPTATVVRKKALVFQGENLERREPVNSNYRAPVVPLSLLRLWAQPLCTIGFLRRIAARVTVGVRQSLLAGSALPLRGQ